MIQVRPLVAGAAAGAVIAVEVALSLWGGFDPATGRIVDSHHPQRGAVLAGRIVVMGSGRGSSSSSSVLAEAARLGTAPAAFVLAEPDEILVVGAVVAGELYNVSVPILVAAPADHAHLAAARSATIATDGTIHL